MKIIAHRGLIDGPNPTLENKPQTIKTALSKGFDAEVDVWYNNHSWYLGHDAPEYKVDFEFINNTRLWIHAKNIEAIQELVYYSWLNSFWHQNDDLVVTSRRNIWALPIKTLPFNCVCVMPEKFMSLDNIKQNSYYAVCTDYANLLTEMLEK
jgi:hypothetical protein